MKRIGDAVTKSSSTMSVNGVEMDTTSVGGIGGGLGIEVEIDYDDIGRDFILTGGSNTRNRCHIIQQIHWLSYEIIIVFICR